MKLLLRLVISTLAVLVASKIVPGVFIEDTGTAIIVAIVLGILNTFLRPVLQILALPITILTLGFFYFVVNVFIIYLATFLISGFQVDGFLSALFFGLAVSIVSAVLGMFLD